MKKLGGQKNDTFIDFNAIYKEFKRYWWLFLASIVLCLALACVYIYVAKPVYQVVSKVLISQDEEGGAGIGSQLVKSLSIGGSSANVDDEVLVFASHDLRTQVAKELRTNCTYIEKKGILNKIDRYNDSPIEISAIGGVFDTLSKALKFKIKVNELGDKIDVSVRRGIFKTVCDVEAKQFPVTIKTEFGVFVVDTTKYYVPGEELNMTAAVLGYTSKAEDYDDNLKVGLASKKSNGISISIQETNVQRGRDVIDKLVQLYNQRCQSEKDEMAVNTGKFLDERLALVYGELAKSEVAIEDYKQRYGVSSLDIELPTLVEKRELSESSRIQLETQYSIVRMIKDFLADTGNDNSMIPFSTDLVGTGKSSNSGSGASIEAYNKLIMEKLKLKNSAKGDNVALKALNEQIQMMKVNVQGNINKLLESLEIQLNDVREQERLAKGKLGVIPTSEREFRELYRQQGIKNTLYMFLLQKREENALVLAATSPKGKVIDRAYALSEPVSLSKFAILFIALCIGLIIPISFIYIKRLLTTKFSTQDELEYIASVPVLGEVCHNRHRSPLVVKAGKTSSIVELFRLLRNNVQFMLPNFDDKVILVTSSVSGEGKSFVSLNIAASFALLGKKVALVGMDIRSPKLHEYLNINARPGVTTYLSKTDVELKDIIQHSGEVDGLDVIVGGPIPPNPSELLLTNRVKEFIDELRNNYDFVIIDSAPIAMVSDTFSLARYSNAVVYVTRANYTKRHFIKYLNEVVENDQLRNVAAVLNDTNPNYSMGYGYGYGADAEQ